MRLFRTELALRPLRPRQSQAIAAIREAVKQGHKRIVLQAPTGYGKTLTAAHLIAGAVAKDKRPLFTCPAINLVNQTVAAFEAEGFCDIGVIQAQHEKTDWSAQIQVASVHTLIRRALPEVDFVLIDECHTQFEKLNEILDGEEWRDKIVIGLTATPWAKGMGRRWTKLIVAATVADLIDEGFLSQFEVYAPPDEYEADLSKVRVVAGEFEETGLQAAMDKPKLVANAVENYLKRGEGRKGFLYAVNRAHAKSLRDEFQAAGVPCGYIDGESDPYERKVTFGRYRRGEDRLIASVGCLVTGIDEDVRVIVDCAPTKSEIVWVQRFGRGLRTADGKDKLLYFDHAGNAIRLGLVTDIHHDHLDDRNPKEKGEAFPEDKKPPKPRKCQKCGAIVPKAAKACPSCKAALAALHNVETADGELVKLTAKPKATKDEKQEFYSELLGLAEERGYKPGWVGHRYREKFGVWPQGLSQVPLMPSRKVRNFDHERRRAFMQQRQQPEVRANA